MSSSSRPNVLIFGGVDWFVGVLVQHLIPPAPSEPLASHVRVVDKYSFHPPTTYFSKNFRSILEERSDLVEYRQANLTNADVVSKAFTDPSPNGLPYTHIIDSTGEIQPDRSAAIYISHTFNVGLFIARASAAQLSRDPGSIKAHIRVMPPLYEHTSPNKSYKETDVDGWKPKDLRCAWWHEMLRAVGSIEGLPLVVVRSGLVYGEGWLRFEVVGIILLGLVYKHLGKELKLLWSPSLPKNSLNSRDLAGILWKTAEWISTKSRSEAITLAGASLPPTNDESVATSNAQGTIPSSAGSVVVPVLHAVDESNSTQASLSEVVGRVFGINVGFQGALKGWLAGMNLDQVTQASFYPSLLHSIFTGQQEINGVHMEAWNEIIANSKPPVPSTPLSPYMPVHFLKKHGCSLDGEKLKTILQYEYKYPKFDERAVKDWIDWCRSEGIWPESSLYTA